MGKFKLTEPGCLGTCWGGKYHYLEPFIGCAHNCVYCYAKSRSNVNAELAKKGCSFDSPSLLIKDKKELLKTIKDDLVLNNVQIVKLSRYTDIFTPPFVSDGTSLEILKTILDTQVKRIVITTKGLPDDSFVELCRDNRERFSFNIVARPNTKLKIEFNSADLDAKLNISKKIMKTGVLTTVHVDPVIPGVDDVPNLFEEYLTKLSAYGLKRLMFSYLVLNKQIIDSFREIENEHFSVESLLDKYETAHLQLLPNQSETSYMQMKPSIKIKSIKILSDLLTSKGFDFVICGLKSSKGEVAAPIRSVCKVCDGSFYA